MGWMQGRGRGFHRTLFGSPNVRVFHVRCYKKSKLFFVLPRFYKNLTLIRLEPRAPTLWSSGTPSLHKPSAPTKRRRSRRNEAVSTPRNTLGWVAVDSLSVRTRRAVQAAWTRHLQQRGHCIWRTGRKVDATSTGSYTHTHT